MAQRQTTTTHKKVEESTTVVRVTTITTTTNRTLRNDDSQRNQMLPQLSHSQRERNTTLGPWDIPDGYDSTAATSTPAVVLGPWDIPDGQPYRETRRSPDVHPDDRYL